MAQNQSCPKCGAILSSDISPESLCAQCLLQLGLESQSNEFGEESWFSALEPS